MDMHVPNRARYPSCRRWIYACLSLLRLLFLRYYLVVLACCFYVFSIAAIVGFAALHSFDLLASRHFAASWVFTIRMRANTKIGLKDRESS